MNAREIAEKLLRGFKAGLDPSIYNHERSVVALTAALEERERVEYLRGIEDAAKVAEEYAISMALAASKAEKQNRTQVASHRYSDSETCDTLKIKIRALAHKSRGEKGDV